MTEKADVLVIGAGIVGTTLALELADAGLSVTVLERRYVGGGSSSLNAGGVRQQFALDINVRVAVQTRRRIDEFAQHYGEEISSRRVGYLFTYAGDHDRKLLLDAMEVQRRWDVPTRPVSPDEIEELVPGIRLDGVRGGVFCPTDGYVDPRATVTAFGRAARRAGARVVQAEVTGVDASNGRVEAVTAGGRRFSAGVYVNAAGAWAPTIARMYGGELPITPMRSEIVALDHALVGGRLTPMVLDYPLGLAFHSEGRGLLVSAGVTSPRPDAPPEVEPEPDRFADVHSRVVKRLPEAERYGMAHAWAGLIEVTPDNNPIVDRTHLDNLFTVAGFSGHGMCLAPGLAAHAAALIRGERPGLPIEAYRYSRFDEGAPLQVETLWSGARA